MWQVSTVIQVEKRKENHPSHPLPNIVIVALGKIEAEEQVVGGEQEYFKTISTLKKINLQCVTNVLSKIKQNKAKHKPKPKPKSSPLKRERERGEREGKYLHVDLDLQY